MFIVKKFPTSQSKTVTHRNPEMTDEDVDEDGGDPEGQDMTRMVMRVMRVML